jgi:UDP-2,3-diacylglucosamine pyrophosphatase LpxH
MKHSDKKQVTEGRLSLIYAPSSQTMIKGHQHRNLSKNMKQTSWRNAACGSLTASCLGQLRD